MENLTGSRIKALRGKTPGRIIAEKVGITQAYFSQIELGQREPSLSVLRAIAEILGTSTAYLMGEINDSRLTAVSALHDHSIALREQASEQHNQNEGEEEMSDKSIPGSHSVNNGAVGISELPVKDMIEMLKSGIIILENEKKARIFMPPTKESYSILQGQIKSWGTEPLSSFVKHQEDGDAQSA